MLSRRRFLGAIVAAPLLPYALRAEGAPAPPPMTGIDDFGFALHRELCKSKGNIFTSPYSISTALAMTAAGAHDTTLHQMRAVLHQAGDFQQVEAGYAKIAKSLASADKTIQINAANALWGQPGYPWAPEYKKRVKDNFDAKIEDTNFAQDPEKARKTINAWVEKQTKDKIKDLLAEGVITNLTRLVLTNAVYFKADWLEAFKKDLTKDLPFTALDGTKKNVPLMHRKGKADYYTNNDVIAVRLPYKGKDVSFIGLLPKNPEKFAEFEKDTAKNNINLWLSGLKPSSDVQVWLPRFKVESSYSLKAPLEAMGMIDAFDPAKANFNGMVSGSSAAKLFISAVVHKAFVDVNEEGTEAAAATGVVVGLTSAPIQQEPKIFRADRPFLFLLRHNPTGTNLFLGRYSTPM